MNTKLKIGVFSFEYSLFLNSKPGHAIQFGMDFTMSHTQKKSLSQLIFPATDVGKNKSEKWNVDNHITDGTVASLIFSKADSGTINDGPRELSARNKNTLTTKFAIYIIDKEKAVVYKNGIKFGYQIDTNSATPTVVLISPALCEISNEQIELMKSKCNFLKFQ